MKARNKRFKKNCERICFTSMFVNVCALLWLSVELFCNAPYSLPAVVICVSSCAVASLTAWLGKVFE